MKKMICLMMAIVMMGALSACAGIGGCDKCDEIMELQKELAEANESLSQINAALEGSSEHLELEERVSSIDKQIDILLQHECPLPPENVKNMELTIGDYSGEYTGEIKCGVPHGKGVFEGVAYNNENDVLEYDGEWANGKLNGNGINIRINYSDGKEIVLDGEFNDNIFSGTGTKRVTSNSGVRESSGEWENSNRLINGEYTEWDANGNVIDYGTYENGYITYSAREEAERKRQEEELQRQQEALGELAGGFIDWILS